jgi:hypothetical protein
MSYVSNIHPGNESLQFIDARLLDNNYRGDRSSEHNRYDMDEIYKMLISLNKHAPGRALMRIRDTDTSKRPFNTVDETKYANFCEEVKVIVGKGTQDSIRKNIFVDLHRMGLIERYDLSENPIPAYARISTKYVALTKEGIKFITTGNILDRAFIFSRALDKLLVGYLEITLNILKNDDFGITNISKYEFMFFVSAINTNTTFGINFEQCIGLIKSYRLLSRIQQCSVVETLKSKLKPEYFPDDKPQQRDWHNWQNKIDQVYHLFNQTPYFDVTGENKDMLSLATKKITTKSGEFVDIRKRSIAEKFAYYENHKVNKTIGFELHHVVPLSWADSAEQYKLFDKWQNMVYIDALSHAKITQNSNRNIFMAAKDNSILLSDLDNNCVCLKNDDNILYLPSNQKEMLDYNRELTETV